MQSFGKQQMQKVSDCLSVCRFVCLAALCDPTVSTASRRVFALSQTMCRQKSVCVCLCEYRAVASNLNMGKTLS